MIKFQLKNKNNDKDYEMLWNEEEDRVDMWKEHWSTAGWEESLPDSLKSFENEIETILEKVSIGAEKAETINFSLEEV